MRHKLTLLNNQSTSIETPGENITGTISNITKVKIEGVEL